MLTNCSSKSRRRKAYLTGLVIFSLLVVSGCGFQLRGTGQSDMWPTQLQKMQLRFDDSADGDFRASLRNRLTDSYEVQIVKKAAPELVVSGVRIERRVLSLSATGKASEFLLRFQVSFALLYSDGSTMIEKQTVRLQRDFRFDNTNILASKLEETRLSEQMQNDAVRRILRRVQALTKNL